MPDITHTHPAVKALELEGFDHEGGTTHSWRCEHPDRYPSYCTCPEETVAIVRDNLTADDLRDTPAGRELMAEAWEEGAQDAWEITGERWNSEYAGEPGDLSSFRVQNPIFPNPHLEGDA